VEIIVTENTVAKGLISVNKVCHCVTYDWWKTHGDHLVNQPVWNIL